MNTTLKHNNKALHALLAFLLAITLAVVGLLAAVPAAHAATALTTAGTESKTTQMATSNTGVSAVAMMRLYNPKSGEHLYTKDANEKKVLTSKHGWKYEGTAWYAPTKSKTPVYRLYNYRTGEHLYTTDANERKVLLERTKQKKSHWKYEGVGWYSDDNKTVALTRLYNSKVKAIGSHHYTLDSNEVKVLTSKHGWKKEGIAWYGVKVQKTIQQVPALRCKKCGKIVGYAVGYNKYFDLNTHTIKTGSISIISGGAWKYDPDHCWRTGCYKEAKVSVTMVSGGHTVTSFKDTLLRETRNKVLSSNFPAVGSKIQLDWPGGVYTVSSVKTDYIWATGTDYEIVYIDANPNEASLGWRKTGSFTLAFGRAPWLYKSTGKLVPGTPMSTQESLGVGRVDWYLSGQLNPLPKVSELRRLGSMSSDFRTAKRYVVK